MSMTTLAAMIAAVQDVVGGITGVRSAPDVPPEQWGPGVYALVYPATGTFSQPTAGREQGEHTLHLLVCKARVDLRTDWAAIIGLGDSIPAALLSAGTLSGAIMVTDEIRYSFGEFEWGGQMLIGWRFELDVLLTGSL